MVNDRNHRDFFGIAGDLNKIPTPRTVKTIMKQFAQQHFTTMIFLATRTKKLLADDPNVKDWCRWLITAVHLKDKKKKTKQNKTMFLLLTTLITFFLSLP